MIALKIGKGFNASWLEVELGWGHLWLKVGKVERFWPSQF